ncbi:hypothetical protein [Marinobacterium litorale]|uniref:hypothetical protein n=1 Tax=Marinobacterium litorale TaxID=404770 RepID=UPI000407B127|nr:hypothetical protein [Marinobacterium litorale]
MSYASDMQNQTILEQLANTQLAVNMLQSLGLSVLSIDKIGERPRIRIIPGVGCRQLRSGWTRRTIIDGRKAVENVAFVSGCHVSWEERS